MICEECKKEGLKSTVHYNYSTSTAMYCPPYYDEDGKHHLHDMNTTCSNYHCSNGHNFQVVSKNECWCGWGKE